MCNDASECRHCEGDGGCDQQVELAIRDEVANSLRLVDGQLVALEAHEFQRQVIYNK